MQLSMDFFRAMLNVSPKARPPSPLVGTAVAKQFEPTCAVAWRGLACLLEQPALSATLRHSRMGSDHDEQWCAALRIMPFPLGRRRKMVVVY